MVGAAKGDYLELRHWAVSFPISVAPDLKILDTSVIMTVGNRRRR